MKRCWGGGMLLINSVNIAKCILNDLTTLSWFNLEITTHCLSFSYSSSETWKTKHHVIEKLLLFFFLVLFLERGYESCRAAPYLSLHLNQVIYYLFLNNYNNDPFPMVVTIQIEIHRTLLNFALHSGKCSRWSTFHGFVTFTHHFL